MSSNWSMDMIIILCIITCTNLLFLKVSSLERQHLKYKVDQDLEKSIAYVLDYCNENLESKDIDIKNLENTAESRYLNHFDVIVNICRLVRNETTHQQGKKLFLWYCKPKNWNDIVENVQKLLYIDSFSFRFYQRWSKWKNTD